MRIFWTGFGRFLAISSSILFVLSAVAAIWLVQADRRLFQAATYKTALAGQQVYERLPRIIAEQIITTMSYNPCQENVLLCEGLTPELKNCAQQALGQADFNLLAGGGVPSDSQKRLLQPCIDRFGAGLAAGPQPENSGPPPFLASMSLPDWEAVIATLAPADQLRATSEQVIDQAFAFLNGQRETVTISLVSFKKRLAGQPGLEAAMQILRAQPACTPDQLTQLQRMVNGEPGEMTLCLPPEGALALMSPLIQSQLNQFAAQIPDEQELLGPGSGENSAQAGPFAGLRSLRLVMRLSPDLALACLLLVSLLAVRSPKSWLRWWGLPFFVSGLLSILLALGFSAAFERIWVARLAGRIPPYLSLGMVTLLHDLGKAVLRLVLGSISLASLLLGLLGLGLWIGSFFIKESAKAALPPAPAEIPPAA
jgi:hypothetical protein